MAKYWNGSRYSTALNEDVLLYFSKGLRDSKMNQLVNDGDVTFTEFEIETEDEPY